MIRSIMIKSHLTSTLRDFWGFRKIFLKFHPKSKILWKFLRCYRILILSKRNKMRCLNQNFGILNKRLRKDISYSRLIQHMMDCNQNLMKWRRKFKISKKCCKIRTNSIFWNWQPLIIQSNKSSESIVMK